MEPQRGGHHRRQPQHARGRAGLPRKGYSKAVLIRAVPSDTRGGGSCGGGDDEMLSRGRTSERGLYKLQSISTLALTYAAGGGMACVHAGVEIEGVVVGYL